MNDSIKTISFYSFNDQDALAYLRLIGPAKQLGIQIIMGVENGKVFESRVADGDVVVMQRGFPCDFSSYKKVLSASHQYNKPVILDMDDLLFELPDNHPDKLSMVFVDSLLPMLVAAIEVDLITTSTQPLCNYLKKFNDNVKVLPNFLDDNIWQLRSPSQYFDAEKPVIIGYMGSQSHIPDLAMVISPLIEILERYSQKVQLHFWGITPPKELASFSSVIRHNPCIWNYPDFAAYFQTQNIDIFIAPLVDNFFNQCKSELKYLEYSALGAAGVFSNIVPYTNVVVHNYNGLLASTPSEWRNCLISLIENQDLRIKLATHAQEFIKEKWLLSNNAPKWLEYYRRTPKKQSTIKTGKAFDLAFINSLALQLDQKRRLQEEIMQSLVDQVTEQQQQLELLEHTLTNQINQKDEEIQALLSQLNRVTYLYREILNSRSWKIIRRLQKVKSYFFHRKF